MSTFFHIAKWLEKLLEMEHSSSRFDMKRVNREMDWKVNKQLIKVKGVACHFNSLVHNAIMIVI